MSLSPGFPHRAPSLSEVLIERTFAKPPEPFVDGEFLQALERADKTSGVAAGGQAGVGAHTPDPGSGSSPGDADASRAAAPPAKAIDVRV